MLATESNVVSDRHALITEERRAHPSNHDVDSHAKGDKEASLSLFKSENEIWLLRYHIQQVCSFL